MTRDRAYFLLLNFGHFLDHLFMLIFATVAALALSTEWGLSYGELLKFATPGFFAFGVFALPAGWLADKWSRDGMMVIFFIGVGLASIGTGLSSTPLHVGIGLFMIGLFGAIYHPVGLAIVSIKWKDTGMRLASNGVWGNLGVASAALITGYLIDNGGWRMAFILPGFFSIGLGFLYGILRYEAIAASRNRTKAAGPKTTPPMTADYKSFLKRFSAIVFVTTAVSGVIFQSTTFALPKIFDERLQGLANSFMGWFTSGELLSRLLPGEANTATIIGLFAFIVFTVASLAQLIVGFSLDKFGPRRVFMLLAGLQLICFALMPGLTDGLAFVVALGFMLGAFGQISINDYMISKMATGEFRARIYGVRFVVSFTVLAATLPLISYVYENFGFDTLFRILSLAAFIILLTVMILPRQLPQPQHA